MTKTAATTDDSKKKKRVCDKCGTPLKYNRKQKEWYCPQCLFGAYLTDLAQQKAVKKYRQSEKGKTSSKKYEQSEKGKKARDKYLKSEKYKQRRREYNARLKESLRIAREAQLSRAKALTREEKIVSLIDTIREFTLTSKRSPKVSDVITWAEDEHHIRITREEAKNCIKRAIK